MNKVIHACWMIVTSHGIPDTVIQKTVGAAKTYFALPEETKMRVSDWFIVLEDVLLNQTVWLQLDIHKTPNFKGYTALLGENTDSSGRGDLHEGFDFGWEPATTSSASTPRDDGVMSGGNVWPDLPRFREPVLDY